MSFFEAFFFSYDELNILFFLRNLMRKVVRKVADKTEWNDSEFNGP